MSRLDAKDSYCSKQDLIHSRQFQHHFSIVNAFHSFLVYARDALETISRI